MGEMKDMSCINKLGWEIWAKRVEVKQIMDGQRKNELKEAKL